MTEVKIAGKQVLYWDPRRNTIPFLRRFEVGPRVGNFGDLLGPILIQRILTGSTIVSRPSRPRAGSRVLSVGSVMHFARDGDTVWGTGVNGKIAASDHSFRRLDVRALRGPLSRDRLAFGHGIEAPEVYGDPALLIPFVAPEMRNWTERKIRTLGVVPNLHDITRFRDHPGFIDPRRPPFDVIRDILGSEIVAASSLHGVIIAEAFGIPAAMLPASAESPFKYEDYARGTGRSRLVSVSHVSESSTALRARDEPLGSWDHRPLLDAFPSDVFAGRTLA